MRDFPNLYLGLAAPSPLSGITQSYITWHKIEERNIVAFDRISLNITINFGKFKNSINGNGGFSIICTVARISNKDNKHKTSQEIF